MNAETIAHYEAWLERKAAGYDLDDPDDRASFRGDVQDGLGMTKLTHLRGVLAEMVPDAKVPVTRAAVCRALAETQIRKAVANHG